MELSQHEPHSTVLQSHKKIKVQTDTSDFDGADSLTDSAFTEADFCPSTFLYPNWEVGFITLFNP